MPLPSSADLDADLRYAAGRGQIVPRFAPLTRVGDGAVTGFVVRKTWMHPDLGALGPDAILPRAIRLGLAVELDRWILEQACEQVAQWGGEALDALSLVVISCSEAASRNPYLVPLARSAADVAGLPADRLMLTWPARALSTELIEAHHRLGVGVASTGAASVSDPRLDAAVLGRASVHRLLADPTLQNEARSAARWGVHVLARATEDSADLATLAEAGVTLVERGPAQSAGDARAVLTGAATVTA